MKGMLMTELAEIVEHAFRNKDYAVAVDAWVRFNTAAGAENRAAAPATQSNDSPRVAEITIDGISGHLGRSASGTQVQLLINGKLIGTTRAVQSRAMQSSAPANGFRLPVTSLWKYLGDNDRLEVRDSTGTRLPFPGGREVFEIRSPLDSKVPALLKKLQKGFVVSKKGRLIEAFNSDSTHVQNCMDTFYAAHGVMLKTCGRKLFPICGSLLGAIRDKDFIPGDTDLDATFVSPYSNAASVKKDFMNVAKALRRVGYKIAFASSGMRVFPTPESTRKAFSIMLSWKREDGRLEMSYGRMGDLPRIEWPMHFVVGQLGKFSIDVPVESEALLQMSYGDGWRVPDPGFSHAGRKPGNREFLFTAVEKAEMERQLSML